MTAAELAGLPGLPSSERRAREWLDRIKVPARPRAGRVGGGREFDTSVLPEATRKAVLAIQVQRAASSVSLPGAIEQSQAAAELVAPANASPVAVATNRPPASAAEAACADARTILVQHLIGTAMLMGITRATQALSLTLSDGTADEVLLRAAHGANLRKRTGTAVSIKVRTLFAWHAAYLANGWLGLLPAPSKKKAVSELSVEVSAILQAYHSAKGSARNLTEVAQDVTKRLGLPRESWSKLYHQARRALPKLDRTQLIKARHTGGDRAARLPFKRRATEKLLPLDVGIIDGHTFKAKVRHPDHGQPFSPEVSLILDAATRRITGWSTSLSETATAVGAAVCHSAVHSGIHAVMYRDNGKGETAKQLDCPIDGLYARLGTENPKGRPGNPQGRGIIERSWRTHMIRAARQFDTYQGGDVDGPSLRKVTLELQREQRAVDRARKTGDVVTLSKRVPTWQQFIAAVELAIHDYNAEHRHRGLPKHNGGELAGLHMTPDEAWAAMLDTSLQMRPDPAEMRQFFMPSKLCMAARGEVQFLNLRYFAEDLMQVDRQRVSVRYDIHDPSRVWVWTTDGEFVCEAVLDANRSDFFSKPVIEMAREKRVRGMVKRAQQRIDTAMRELTPTLPGGESWVSLADQSPAAALPLVDEVSPRGSVDQAEPLGPDEVLPARPMFDSPSERYQWLMAHRDVWLETDVAWLGKYAQSDEYQSLAEYFEARGQAWSEELKGFKSAG